jgi:hypothetical protein
VVEQGLLVASAGPQLVAEVFVLVVEEFDWDP